MPGSASSTSTGTGTTTPLAALASAAEVGAAAAGAAGAAAPASGLVTVTPTPCGSVATGSVATGLLCRSLTHLATLRGHRVAAYCCMYDNTGRRLCTGSDDCLVKVGRAGCAWDVQVGLERAQTPPPLPP